MTSVCDVLVGVLDLTTLPLILVLKSTVTDATHSGGAAVLQLTLAPGVEPSTLSAFTVTVYIEKATPMNACVVVSVVVTYILH